MQLGVVGTPSPWCRGGAVVVMAPEQSSPACSARSSSIYGPRADRPELWRTQQEQHPWRESDHTEEHTQVWRAAFQSVCRQGCLSRGSTLLPERCRALVCQTTCFATLLPCTTRAFVSVLEGAAFARDLAERQDAQPGRVGQRTVPTLMGRSASASTHALRCGSSASGFRSTLAVFQPPSVRGVQKC